MIGIATMLITSCNSTSEGGGRFERIGFDKCFDTQNGVLYETHKSAWKRNGDYYYYLKTTDFTTGSVKYDIITKEHISNEGELYEIAKRQGQVLNTK